jgi:hypothetical protein
MSARQRKQKRPGNSTPIPIIVLLVLVVGAVAWRVFAPQPAHGEHPQPRTGVTAADVLAASTFAQPDIAETYTMAREIPHVLDGLYCHCECSRHSGHRSLLSCFESEHGSDCEVCMNEARLAHRMHKQGKTLGEIRTQIDAAFSG